MPMTHHYPDETKGGFRKSYLCSSRLEIVFVALGVLCLAALVTMAAVGFGDLGPGFVAGFVVWIVTWVIRLALGYDKSIGPHDDSPDITPAQRVDNVHGKTDD